MNGNHFDIHDLKREYEKGRKQGAVEELEFNIKKLKDLLDKAPIEFFEQKNGGVQIGYLQVIEYLEKRLVELKGEQK